MVAMPGVAQQKSIVTVDEPPSAFRKIGQAEISYFSATDTTEVRTEWPAYRNKSVDLSMWFEFRSKGKNVSRPTSVTVNVGCSAAEARLQKITGFKLDLDGHEIKLEQQTATGIQYDLNAQRFLRIMHASLSFDDFEKLVKSNSAKVHVGEGARR